MLECKSRNIYEGITHVVVNSAARPTRKKNNSVNGSTKHFYFFSFFLKLQSGCTAIWISTFHPILNFGISCISESLRSPPSHFNFECFQCIITFLKGAKFVDNWNRKEAITNLYSHSYDHMNNFKDTTQYNFLVKPRNYDHVKPRSSTSLPWTAEYNSSNIYVPNEDQSKQN